MTVRDNVPYEIVAPATNDSAGASTTMADWDPGSFTRNLIAEMRANGGVPSQGPFAGRRLLILTTIGARSRLPRTAVLAYRPEGETLIVAGSKGGAPTHPSWFHNLRAHPVATVEVNNEMVQVRAKIEAEGTERDRLWAEHVAEMPGFGEYPAKTDRIIPMVALTRLA
jgi:deazaflavin-dependent oxidoreductase (nitroreductase family)